MRRIISHKWSNKKPYNAHQSSEYSTSERTHTWYKTDAWQRNSSGERELKLKWRYCFVCGRVVALPSGSSSCPSCCSSVSSVAIRAFSWATVPSSQEDTITSGVGCSRPQVRQFGHLREMNPMDSKLSLFDYAPPPVIPLWHQVFMYGIVWGSVSLFSRIKKF